MDELTVAIHQAQAGAGIVALIEFLKRVGWFPWLTQNTDKLNRILSMVLAFIVSLGIVITGDSSAGWTVHIPPATILLHTALHAIGQGGFQQWFYKQVK